MVAFNFERRFAESIMQGRKRLTIRKRPRCKVGDKLQLYVGMRTNNCRKLLDAICVNICKITIYQHGPIFEGTNLTDFASPDEFAKADGFESWAHLYDLFVERYELAEFKGVMIQW